MFKYALVRNGEVAGLRSYPAPLASNQIKHVDGIPVLRPVEISGWDDPATDEGFKARFFDGYEIFPDKVIEKYRHEWQPDLKDLLQKKIDEKAEEVRLLYITPGSGQALTYQRKLEEARQLLAGDPGPFPLLEASVGIDGATVQDVANVVMQMNDLWTQAAATIESARLGGKKAVREAETPEDAYAVYKAIVWPSPA